MTAKVPCPVCTKIGLPILPARYTVVPDDFGGADLSFSGEQVTSVQADGVKYAARIVRQGFVYVFYEKSHLGANKWQVYAVSLEGKLHLQLSASAAKYTDQTEVCSRCGSGSFNKDFFVIEQPDQCGTTWLAFSEHKWSDATVQQYQSDAGLRARRMQPIEPAVWVGGASAGNHQLILALPENLNAIVEYAPSLPWSSITHEPETFPCEGYGVARPEVHRDGRFDVDWLRARSTLYPWYRRNAADGAPAQSLFEQMLAACGGQDTQRWPMMIALWDAVSIAHELNGFRNDVQGRFAWYCHAHERHVSAMQAIDAAKVAVEQGAQNKVARTETWVGVDAGDPYGRSHLLPPFLTHAPDTPALGKYLDMREQYVTGAIDLQQFRTRRAAMDKAHATVPGKLEEALLYDEERLQARREDIARRQREKVTTAWDDYEERLSRPHLDGFRRNFESLDQWRRRLLAERTPALEAWLSAPLLLATLEDYDKGREDDGKRFNAVVEEALSGLEEDDAGKAVLKALIDNTDPTDPASLVWRAVALNQKQAISEVDDWLTAVKQHRNTSLQTTAGTFDGVAKGLKVLASLYVSVDGAGNQRVAPIHNAKFREMLRGGDKLINSIGTLVFEKWRVAQLGDYVGEKLIQHVFALRLGVAAEDSRNLVATQALHEPAIRRLYLSQVDMHIAAGKPPKEAMGLAMVAVTDHHGSQALRKTWDGLRVNHSPKFAVLVLLCDGMNLFKLFTKADKEREDWALLAAAGLSTASALSQVMVGVFGAMMQERAKTLGHWKAIGAGLAAPASFIQAAVDVVEGEKQSGDGYVLAANLYRLKAIAGFAVGSAFFVTAVSSSSHLVQKLVGRNGTVVVLERIHTGIVDAAVAKRAVAQGGREVARRGLYASIGRGVLMLVGWKATMVVVVIQGAVWYFTPDELEKWLDKTPFGSKVPFNTLMQQQEAYHKVLVEMDL